MEAAAVLEVLNRLLAASQDCENRYRTAAGNAQRADLKTLFESYAGQRAQFIAELQKEIGRHGVQPEGGSSIGGTLYREWQTLKSSLGASDDLSLIAACAAGEEAARSAYEQALKEPLPNEVRSLAERQFAAVQEGADRLRALEQAGQALAARSPATE